MLVLVEEFLVKMDIYVDILDIMIINSINSIIINCFLNKCKM